jgi:hypothetical protein
LKPLLARRLRSISALKLCLRGKKIIDLDQPIAKLQHSDDSRDQYATLLSVALPTAAV